MLLITAYRIGNTEPAIIMPVPNYSQLRQYWLRHRRGWSAGGAHRCYVGRIETPAVEWRLLISK